MKKVVEKSRRGDCKSRWRNGKQHGYKKGGMDKEGPRLVGFTGEGAHAKETTSKKQKKDNSDRRRGTGKSGTSSHSIGRNQEICFEGLKEEKVGCG